MWVIIDDPKQPAAADTQPDEDQLLRQRALALDLDPRPAADRLQQLPHIDEALQLEAATGRRFQLSRPGLRHLGQLALIAALLLVGVAQYLLYNQQRLLQEPAWRPLYQSFCSLAGCALPPRADLPALRSESLQITPHPVNNDYRLVSLQLFNSARFAQPFPALELSFSDIHGQTIATDRLLPQDYLPAAGLPVSQQLAANSLRQLELTLVNPGDTAVNYHLALGADPAVHARGLIWPDSTGVTVR